MSRRLIKDYNKLIEWRARIVAVNKLPQNRLNIQRQIEAMTGYDDLREDVFRRIKETIDRYSISYNLKHVQSGYRGIEMRRKHLRKLNDQTHATPMVSVVYLQKLKEFQETNYRVADNAIAAIKDLLLIK